MASCNEPWTGVACRAIGERGWKSFAGNTITCGRMRRWACERRLNSGNPARDASIPSLPTGNTLAKPRCSRGLSRQSGCLGTTLAHRPGVEWRADRHPALRRPSPRVLLRYAHPGTRLPEPAITPRQSLAHGRCSLTETVKDVSGQTVKDVLGLDIRSFGR
jgi:hypothetical protein